MKGTSEYIAAPSTPANAIDFRSTLTDSAMSGYDISEAEDDELRAWFHWHFVVLPRRSNGRPLRMCAHPSMVDGENCRACGKERTMYGSWTNNARCRLCQRFRVSAPILRSSNFCSCPCDCYEASDLTPNNSEDANTMSDDSYQT